MGVELALSDPWWLKPGSYSLASPPQLADGIKIRSPVQQSAGGTNIRLSNRLLDAGADGNQHPFIQARY